MKRRTSPQQLANLQGGRWKKGESGNPKGRPPKLPDLKELLCKVLGEEKHDITAAEAILRSLLSRAVKGDVRAAEVLLERGYGKVLQSLGITGEITQVVVKRKK